MSDQDNNPTVFPTSPAATFLHELNRRYTGLKNNLNEDDQARIALHEAYKRVANLLEALNASLFGDFSVIERRIRMSAVQQEFEGPLAARIDDMDARFVARRGEMHQLHVFCVRESLSRRPAGSGPVAAQHDAPGIYVDTRNVVLGDDVSFPEDSAPFGSLLQTSSM
jgi:hypothetical protein